MTDITQYVPLKTVVSYCIDENDQSVGSFDRAWLLGFRALVDLLFDISAHEVTVRLPVSDNKTVAFPADYLSWVRIAILNERGEESTLRINNALTKYKDDNPNRIERLTPDITDALPISLNVPFFYNYSFNNQYRPLFGVGGA